MTTVELTAAVMTVYGTDQNDKQAVSTTTKCIDTYRRRQEGRLIQRIGNGKPLR